VITDIVELNMLEIIVACLTGDCVVCFVSRI